MQHGGLCLRRAAREARGGAGAGGEKNSCWVFPFWDAGWVASVINVREESQTLRRRWRFGPTTNSRRECTQSVQAVKCLRVLAMVLSVDTALLAHAAQSATPLSHILMLTSALPFPLHWGLKRLHTEGLPFRMQPPPRRCADPFASRPQQLSHHPCPHTASDGRAGALPARIH